MGVHLSEGGGGDGERREVLEELAHTGAQLRLDDGPRLLPHPMHAVNKHDNLLKDSLALIRLLEATPLSVASRVRIVRGIPHSARRDRSDAPAFDDPGRVGGSPPPRF